MKLDSGRELRLSSGAITLQAKHLSGNLLLAESVTADTEPLQDSTCALAG